MYNNSVKHTKCRFIFRQKDWKDKEYQKEKRRSFEYNEVNNRLFLMAFPFVTSWKIQCHKRMEMLPADNISYSILLYCIFPPSRDGKLSAWISPQQEENVFIAGYGQLKYILQKEPHQILAIQSVNKISVNVHHYKVLLIHSLFLNSFVISSPFTTYFHPSKNWYPADILDYNSNYFCSWL